MDGLEVTIAAADERPIIERMMQLYTHDFSEQWWDRPDGELQDDGLFSAYPLDPYWRDADHIPLLIRRNGKLAGFALLNATSHSGRAVDRNMAEFFVARKHRRGGVGMTVARMIFSRWPGVWEAAVARRNVSALAFWRRAAKEHPGAEAFEEFDVSTAEWNGPVLRFQIGGG